ncbi:MAG: hypothetical protein KC731_25190 [Myxococcales bacterium]|nr:hypothetical protein [Myxococcales bacterium]
MVVLAGASMGCAVRHPAGYDHLASRGDRGFSFDVTLGDTALGCTSGDGLSQLSCQERSSEATLVLGSGRACAQLNRTDLMLSPGCWSGELRFDGERYPFAYAQLEDMAVPVSRVAWLDGQTGAAVQSYEGITTWG